MCDTTPVETQTTVFSPKTQSTEITQVQLAESMHLGDVNSQKM